MKTRNFIICFTVLCLVLFTSGLARATTLSFSQMDFNFDGTTSYTDTEWGAVDLAFTGQAPIMYFNVAINGSWQVQNIPVLSLQGVSVGQTMTFYFDLGTPRGTEVSTLNYDYAFTSSILDTMPSGSTAASVGDGLISMWAGFDGGLMPSLATASPLVGGEAESPTKHGHKNFPNQQCGPKECVHAAVSNSLQFLNRVKKLKMDPNKISITEMKKAVGFTPGTGSPLDTWWEKKKKYMEDNKYPITTRKITDMSKLIAEIDGKQDVEIQESWIDPNGKKTGHTTALVGITKLKNGKYSLDVVDDRNQDDPAKGCDKPRTYTYDPQTGKILEAGFGYTTFEYAVVECPEPATVLLLCFGGLALLRKRRFR